MSSESERETTPIQEVMEQKDIRTLHILESVERDSPPSQRDLARELGISLGLVNAFVKRLVKKGYFKVTHIPKNRIRYMLTPEGAAEKTRLTYAYIQHSYKLYKNVNQKLRQMIFEMEGKGIRRIILFGASDLAEIAYLLLPESQIQVIGIVDDDKVGKKIAGNTVSTLDLLRTASYDSILITSLEPTVNVLKMLKDTGIAREKITTLIG